MHTSASRPPATASLFNSCAEQAQLPRAPGAHEVQPLPATTHPPQRGIRVSERVLIELCGYTDFVGVGIHVFKPKRLPCAPFSLIRRSSSRCVLCNAAATLLNFLPHISLPISSFKCTVDSLVESTEREKAAAAAEGIVGGPEFRSRVGHDM